TGALSKARAVARIIQRHKCAGGKLNPRMLPCLAGKIPLSLRRKKINCPLVFMKSFNIAALAGDGIGNEVMAEAVKVLRAAEKKFGFQLNITAAPVGWAGIDAAGKALPDATLA